MYSKEEQPIVCEDIVIASSVAADGRIPYGEFGLNPAAFGGPNITREQAQDPLVRLRGCIRDCMNLAAEQHEAHNYDPNTDQLKPGKLNHITRLITNEFFFYTAEPLTMLMFESLMKSIFISAQFLPENLHCILGSFAVKTEDGCVLNVVPEITCGSKPSINCHVKNRPPACDPVYYEENANGTKKVLNNVGIQTYQHNLPSPFALNATTKCVFSYDTGSVHQTAGGVPFYSFVEICADHGLAREHLNHRLNTAITAIEASPATEHLPKQCLHTIVSNWINVKKENCLGNTTQADPVISHRVNGCKANVASQNSVLPNPVFGTPATVMRLQPTALDPLPQYELNKVEYYNAMTDKPPRDVAFMANEDVPLTGDVLDPNTKQTIFDWCLDSLLRTGLEAYYKELQGENAVRQAILTIRGSLQNQRNTILGSITTNNKQEARQQIMDNIWQALPPKVTLSTRKMIYEDCKSYFLQDEFITTLYHNQAYSKVKQELERNAEALVANNMGWDELIKHFYAIAQSMGYSRHPDPPDMCTKVFQIAAVKMMEEELIQDWDNILQRSNGDLTVLNLVRAEVVQVMQGLEAGIKNSIPSQWQNEPAYIGQMRQYILAALYDNLPSIYDIEDRIRTDLADKTKDFRGEMQSGRQEVAQYIVDPGLEKTFTPPTELDNVVKAQVFTTAQPFSQLQTTLDALQAEGKLKCLTDTPGKQVYVCHASSDAQLLQEKLSLKLIDEYPPTIDNLPTFP